MFREALDAISQADVIVLGPGSLFESTLPNLLIPELRAAVQHSKARKIYICSLMTEPGLTDGFSVAARSRQIVRYGGFAPDYVLVNAQRIDSDVRRIYSPPVRHRSISTPRSTRKRSSARPLVWQRVM